MVLSTCMEEDAMNYVSLPTPVVWVPSLTSYGLALQENQTIETVCVWPCGSFCHLEDLAEFSKLMPTADYEVMTIGDVF